MCSCNVWLTKRVPSCVGLSTRSGWLIRQHRTQAAARLRLLHRWREVKQEEGALDDLDVLVEHYEDIFCSGALRGKSQLGEKSSFMSLFVQL